MQGSCICFEIAEPSLIENLGDTGNFIRSLKELLQCETAYLLSISCGGLRACASCS